MYRLVSWFLLLTLVMVAPVEAAFNKTLLTIDDTEYTTQDFRDWWGIWQDPGMDFPANPQGFIDYLLFVEEGRLMEYDLDPGYKRKLEVFLKVRSLAALKYDEIDSKINVTEKQIRDFFTDNYAPIWTMQLLGYDELIKAQKVVDDMKAFNGNKAGRLLFADFAGVKVEDGGPLSYEEVSVDPATISQTKNEHWLPVISNLQKWFVSEPFFLEKENRYIVIRMDDINAEPGEDALETKRPLIKKKLKREAAGKLTRQLVERLKKEQHVEVDEALLAQINLQEEYSEETLSKPVVKMDGQTISVGLLIQNMNNQRQIRQQISEDQLKGLMVSTLISEAVTNYEALNRHYEDRPPLKVVYDFYSDNTLRKSLESGIKKGIKISTEEIQNYYDNNLSLYNEPARISYVVLESNADLINTVYAAISKGADFFDQAQAYSLDAEIKTVGIDEVRSQAIKTELAKLKKGEISAPFAKDTNYAIVRLLNRAEGNSIPLAQARAKIEERLRKEKFGVAKALYLEKLRSRAKITVNQSVWGKLKKEYEK